MKSETVQDLVKRNFELGKEIQTLKEEIKKLKERVKNLGFNNDYVEEVEDKNWNLGQQLEKRDKLLEQAKEKLMLLHGRYSEGITKYINQWLKDYEELK